MDSLQRRPYSVAEASEKAGVNPKTLYEGIRTGQVPSLRIGNRILVPRPAFDRLLEEGRAADARAA